MITEGNSVRVYPHGSPDQVAVGTVIIISGSQRAIAVAFDDMPPFAFIRGGGIAIDPEHGVMFFAYREELGPWIEMGNQGHYEIEEM